MDGLMPVIALKYVKSAFNLLNEKVDRMGLICKINSRPTYLPVAKEKEKRNLFQTNFLLVEVIIGSY